MRRLCGALVLLLVPLASCRQPLLVEPAITLTNLDHLDHLVEEIDLKGERVSIVHVYADYPDYHWVDAKDSGVEGVACVDDAARAVVAYLHHYELTRERSSLMRGRSLLGFVLLMQAEDGEFYNFIHANPTINTTGPTSRKSFGWWAARGLWALAVGYRTFSALDSAFAMRLQDAIQLSLPRVRDLLKVYGRSTTREGYRVPGWLLQGSGADATSELLLGLTEYYRSRPDTLVRSMIRGMAEGLMLMQDGDARTYPYGLHRSWETHWHMWGNSQTQALAAAGALLADSQMVRSAEREAVGYYPRLLIDGFVKEFDLLRPEEVKRYEQIAYGVRPMAVGLVRLSEATGNIDYLKMAGLTASWLFGNNVLHEPLYDPSTGRCFDGIKDSVTLNRNSGAESTIEGLMTVMEMEGHPVATNYLNYRRIRSMRTPEGPAALFLGPRGDTLALVLDERREAIAIREPAAAR